jgi:hypothetical protein
MISVAMFASVVASGTRYSVCHGGRQRAWRGSVLVSQLLYPYPKWNECSNFFGFCPFRIWRRPTPDFKRLGYWATNSVWYSHVSEPLTVTSRIVSNVKISPRLILTQIKEEYGKKKVVFDAFKSSIIELNIYSRDHPLRGGAPPSELRGECFHPRRFFFSRVKLAYRACGLG